VGTEVVVAIRIVVENPDEMLRPGYSVDLEIIQYESTNAINVPLMSLTQGDNGGFAVFVVENNIMRRRNIEVGISTPTSIEVLSGINVGDTIILTPTEIMQDGDPVPEEAILSQS
jgi:HlyD family secretion protein